MQASFTVQAAALVLASSASVALAAVDPGAAWQQVQSRGVLRVGTPGDYLPYALLGAGSGYATGADIALAREIAIDAGLGVEFIPTSWGTLLDDARAGRFDIALGGISITPEREREQRFTKPYARDYKAPVTRCGEEQRFDSVREINRPGVRVVVNPGGTNERFAREEFPAAQLTVHRDNPTVFDEIVAGRADVMVTDSVEGRMRSASTPGLCVAGRAPHWAPMRKAILVAGDARLQREIDGALERALRRSRYEERLAPWVSHDWPGAAAVEPVSQLARLADERLIVVTEVARWKWNRKAPIEDLPREQSLLAAQRAAAAARGIPAARVEEFFLAQIDAAKQLQRDLFRRWEQEQRLQFSGVADLDTRLRPQIDALNARMLDALARWDGAARERRSLGPLSIEPISPQAVEVALVPLTVGR